MVKPPISSFHFDISPVSMAAILHLLYARFITYFLHDLGLVREREPFKKLLTQVEGLVMLQTFGGYGRVG